MSDLGKLPFKVVYTIFGVRWKLIQKFLYFMLNPILNYRDGTMSSVWCS